ncbi:outer membrane beta-barrel protein [uncultured Draconibacterium sp.]|uniref:outer membrane beta-barrel protein n=1 Tax=uncultured Draconibacterium sp. TaxID=1573823 RepID=UPI0032176C7F
MNKTFFVLLFLLSFTSLIAQDTKWQFSSSLGIDMGGAIPLPLSEVPDDAKGTPKLKPNLGIAFQRNFNERWSLGTELSYHTLSIDAIVNVVSQAFWSDDRSYATYFSGEAYSSTELQFIEIPIQAYYHVNSRWSLVLGAYYSVILKGKLETEGRNGWISADKNDTDTAPLPGTQNTFFNFNDELDNYDVGMLLGYRWKVSERVHLWGRFNVGFKSIFVPDFNNIDYEMYQFRFSTGVSFVMWKQS